MVLKTQHKYTSHLLRDWWTSVNNVVPVGRQIHWIIIKTLVIAIEFFLVWTCITTSPIKCRHSSVTRLSRTTSSTLSSFFCSQTLFNTPVFPWTPLLSFYCHIKAPKVGVGSNVGAKMVKNRRKGALGESLTIYRTAWAHEQRVLDDYLVSIPLSVSQCLYVLLL